MILSNLTPPLKKSFSHGGMHETRVPRKRVSFGIQAIDDRLSGGLDRNALHEIYASNADDGSSAAAFAMLLAMRACAPDSRIIWVREDRCVRRCGNLYPLGLSDFGLCPDDMLSVIVPDTLSALRAGADAVKCSGVGAVIIEPHGKAALLDLTASRRLSMAAAASGVFTLVLRIEAEPLPSAAQTRWNVTSAPSAPLAANAPGFPAFDIMLLRHRGGIAGFDARMEWNSDARTFAPLSGGVPAVSANRTDQTRKAA